MVSKNEGLSQTLLAISRRLCERTKGEAGALSFTTLRRINDVHVPGARESLGNEYNPSMHQDSTISQYLQVLASLALFLIRACITDVRDESYYGVPLHFTDEQKQTAATLHGAVVLLQANAKDGDLMETAADALCGVAMSVLFTLSNDPHSAAWTSTWRRFFTFSVVDANHKSIHHPGKIAVWLSKMRFIMKLVATHHMYTLWYSQSQNGILPPGAKTDDQLE